MENKLKKGKVVPFFKNLGFIVPKKKRSGNAGAAKHGDGSSAENSPFITDDSSNSSTTSVANLSDFSDISSTDQNASIRKESTTDTKSDSEEKKATKPAFVKPAFSAISKPAASKKTDTFDSELKTAAKSSPKNTPKKTVVGTPLTDDQYYDIFSAVMDRVSQVESSCETETNFENSMAMPSTSAPKKSEQQESSSNIMPKTTDENPKLKKNVDENANKLQKTVFAKPNIVPKKITTVAKKAAHKTVPVKSTVTKTPSETDNNEKNSSVAKKASSKISSIKSIPKVTSVPKAANTLNNKKNEETSIAMAAKGGAYETEINIKTPQPKSSNSNKKQGQSKKCPAKSPTKASTSALKEKQKPSPKSRQSVNTDSISIDDSDSETDNAESVYKNTQLTKWGNDRSIIYDEPPNVKSYKEKMIYLRQSRNIGLWVKCMNKGCGKWRYCQEMKDPLQVPEVWTCSMNSDMEFNNCNYPEQRQPWAVKNEVDVIQSKYSAGSVVWALVRGHPWWPAIVDDDPNTETFWWVDNESCTVPEWYHVVFFDRKDHKVSRAWVTDRFIEPYDPSNNYRCHLPNVYKSDKSLVSRFQAAREEATRAFTMPVLDRLEKYGFISRYQGPIRKPTLEIDSSSEDEDSQMRNNSIASSSSIRIHRIVQGQGETRKRKNVNKLKKLVKIRKVVAKYTMPTSSTSKKESENEDSSEEDDETEEMQVDEDSGEEDDQVVSSENENEEESCNAIEVGDERDENKVNDKVDEKVNEKDEEGSCNTTEEGEDRDENDVDEDLETDGEREDGVVDNNDTSNSSTCFHETNNTRAVKATEIIPASQYEEKSKINKSKQSPQKLDSSLAEKDSSTFFNGHPQSTTDDKFDIDVVNVTFKVDVQGNLDSANVVHDANDDDDDEWSDRSIISDADSNSNINVNEMSSSSTIDLCSTSNSEREDGTDVSETDENDQ